LKLAIVRARYTAFGGAEQFALRAMQSLAAGGAQVTLIARSWQQQPGIETITCNPRYLGSLWRDWSFERAACKAIRGRQFDLVQSHERIACCDIYRAGNGIHQEWLTQRRRVLGTAGRLRLALNPYHHYLAAAERRLYASTRLKAVICNSQMVREEIVRWFGAPEAKLHVIYSGVDTEKFHPKLRAAHLQATREKYAIPADAVLYLLVGSGFERKGVAPALHALRVLGPNAYLLIVGKDKRAREYRTLADRLGVLARVRFAGPLKEVAACYGAADVFVLPTLYDPFPNVALEAMASGLPVITSLKSGARELIDPGVEGWVCDALDSAALARHMAAAQGTEVRAAMARAARARVEGFTLENMAREYFRLYENVLTTQR
jgi:UDP-glucose:(heptosyl)LPS alpha-1,3-glucosyltransferase